MTAGFARQAVSAGVIVHPQVFVEVWKSHTVPATVE